MRQLVQHHLIFLSVAALVMFTNLGGPPLWDRDEPRNAGCADEMLRRGDWITPYFNSEMRTHKPVLLYWLMMSAYQMFGVSEFAARFWCAALAVGTVTLTYHLGRRLFDPRIGLWAAVILATTLMFGVAGRAATPDSLLIFFSTAAITAYVLNTFAPVDEAGMPLPMRLKRPGQWFPTWGGAVAMYALMGLAVLAKGPVGLVLPTAVLGMFLLVVRLEPVAERPSGWKGRLQSVVRPFAPGHFLRTCGLMLPLTAIVIAGAVAAPWYLWVGLRTEGEWLKEFFLTHNVSRATSAMEGHHGPFFYYPLVLLVGFAPWSVFAGPMLIDLSARLRRKDGGDTTGLVFALCWVCVWVVLFTIPRTKLPSYVTPMYPGLALLVGVFIDRWTRGELLVKDYWPRLSMVTFALIGMGLLIALPLVAHFFLPGDEALGLLGVAPLAGAVCCAYLMRQRLNLAAATVFSVAATCFLVGLFAVAADRIGSHQRLPQMLSAISAETREPHIVALNLLEPGWVFYARRPIDSVGTEEEALSCLGRGKDCYVVVSDKAHQQLAARLPPETRVVARVPRFLRSGEMIVLHTGEATLARQPEATPR